MFHTQFADQSSHNQDCALCGQSDMRHPHRGQRKTES